MDTHRETEKERADAIRWLCGAGAGALALSFFAYSVDRYMESASTRDRAHSDMLAEIRSAQTSLPSRVTDDRLKVRIPLLEKTDAMLEAPAHDVAAEEHDH